MIDYDTDPTPAHGIARPRERVRRFYDAGDRPSGLATLLGLDVVPAHQLDRTALVLDLLADASVDRPTGAARLPPAVRALLSCEEMLAERLTPC